jgi:hypothetical protein
MAFRQVILPIALEYKPELVIISAGFDAAMGDPLGGCNVTPVCLYVFSLCLYLYLFVASLCARVPILASLCFTLSASVRVGFTDLVNVLLCVRPA